MAHIPTVILKFVVCSSEQKKGGYTVGLKLYFYSQLWSFCYIVTDYSIVQDSNMDLTVEIETQKRCIMELVIYVQEGVTCEYL